MENVHIKIECEKAYSQIKEAEERLKELREMCRHEKTFIGNYSWRVGHVAEAEICEFCGTLIRYL